MTDVRDQLEAAVARALFDMTHADCETCEGISADPSGVIFEHDPTDGFDAQAWADDQLEAYATAVLRYGSTPSIESVTLVTGTGGPHVEVRWNASGSVEAEGWWGSDRVRQSLYGPEADAFAVWAEDYADGLAL